MSSVRGASTISRPPLTIICARFITSIPPFLKRDQHDQLVLRVGTSVRDLDRRKLLSDLLDVAIYLSWLLALAVDEHADLLAEHHPIADHQDPLILRQTRRSSEVHHHLRLLHVMLLLT